MWLVFLLLALVYHSAPIAMGQAPDSPEALVVQPTDAERCDAAARKAHAGDPIGALQTLARVTDQRLLARGLADLQAVASTGSQNRSTGPDGSRDGDAPAGSGGPGGGSLADFTSLMDLIQTTVVPDTWEALGGPSTMSPYVAGIFVDGAGVVQDITTSESDSSIDNLEIMLSGMADGDGAALANRVDAPGAWRMPSKYRCVSLSRLAKHVLRCRIGGNDVDVAARSMAGLSQIQYLIVDESNEDVILVGAIGGIEQRDGWMRDQKTGLVVVQLESFVAAATSILANQPFGCTIDPTAESMAAAAKVADDFRAKTIPIGMAPEAVRNALGNQDVRVFGTAGDTPLGYLMVQADRHMKQLALGLQPMPRGIPNYLDMITRHIDSGAPDGQLLRLWFTGAPMAVRVDDANRIYEFAGNPIRLASETAMARADGNRDVAPPDERVIEFVAAFNDSFRDIVSEYPIYGALRSVYVSASVAEVIRRSDAAPWMTRILGAMLLDDPSMGRLQTPRKVASVATLHRVTHRGKRHAIIVASGGVMVETSQTVEPDLRRYDANGSLVQRFVADEPSNDRAWWWDSK